MKIILAKKREFVTNKNSVDIFGVFFLTFLQRTREDFYSIAVKIPSTLSTI
jgi:hypothetical protein